MKVKCYCCKRELEEEEVKLIGASVRNGELTRRYVCIACDKRETDLSVKVKQKANKYKGKKRRAK